MRALNLTTALLLGSAAGIAQVQVDGDMYIGPGVEVHVFEDMTNTGDFNINNTALLHVRGDINMEGSAQQNLAGHVIVDKLHQDNGSGVVVANGSQVEVYEALELSDGTMTANSPVIMKSLPAWTAYVDNFSPGFGGDYTGDLTMERYVSTGGYHHMGAAVDVSNISTELSEAGVYGPNMGQVIPLPSCDPTYVDGSSPYGVMFEWHENAPFINGCNLSGWFVRSSGAMDAGRGYTLNLSAGSTFDLSGPAHMNTVSYGPLGNTNGIGNGLHLVSNPYPSDIEYAAPVSGFDAAVYIWQSSGQYAGTYQATFPGAGTRIASQQAFFARKSSGSGNYTVPLNWRRTGSSTYYRTAAHQGLEVVVKGAGFADRTQVNFDPMATTDFEPEVDAMKIRHMNGQPFIASTNGLEELSVNTLDLQSVNEIPLVFAAKIEGGYVLEFDTEEEGFWLEDRQEGYFQPLPESYAFQWSEGDEEDRFIIHYRLNEPEVELPIEAEMLVFTTHRDLVIQGADAGAALVQFYDMAGKLTWQNSEFLNEGVNRIGLPEMPMGQYIIRVQTDNDITSIKAILN